MTTNPDVEAWFGEYEHPAKDAMLRVREIILSDDRMTETIKWKSPTFMYEGNMASFNPRTKAHVSLMFHAGASIPGDHPRLEGGGETARYMKFADLADVEESAGEISAVVAAWCDSRSCAPGRAGPKDPMSNGLIRCRRCRYRVGELSRARSTPRPRR